ncbi:transglycosylase SLT domain-containing protein [Corynebacterium qintianiae]|uniref:transglycosylase SLT domain-containing protein n=1 Tax=Corynebacterium qintianiae TaxID=2709392 RepID=UPI001981BA2C|nr:transglycosylase SLT domain-containing protein [Corynebacterium qintianiae]
MASAVGYAVLPVVPSFSNISKEIEKQIAQPLMKASKSAGDALAKGVGDGAENAAKAVEKAQYRVKMSTQELEVAESKLAEKRDRAKAAAIELERAARARAEAEGKGIEAVEKAEISLARKRAASEKAARELTSAEQDVEKAMAESAKASKSLEDRQEALADAQADAAREAERYAGVLGRFRESAERAGSGLVQAAEKLKVHASVVLGGVGALVASSTAYASEAEQSYGAVESIFAGHADAIVSKSKEAAAAVGLSGREYRELSSVTGAMLKNMGLPMEEVTAKTQDLVGVAADLSATFGGSTKDAIEAVNALMRGEADPIERYGVSIKKADVNARLAAEGLDKLEGEALKQAEAQTLLAMLTEQTASAQGQFARETDTAAHKQQVATARMNDAREAIGTALLPVMADLADFAAKVAEKIGEHPQIFLAVAGAVAALAAGVVALSVAAPIFTAISVAAGAAGTSMWGYVAAQAAAIAPIVAVVAGVAALAAGLTYFFTKTETGRAVWEKLVTSFQVGVEKIKRLFAGVADTAKTVYGILFKGDFEGNNGLFGLGDESSKTVDFLFSVRDTVLQVYNILFKGDYMAGSGFFGLNDESSKFANALFVVRDAVIAVKDGVVAAFSAMGNVIKWSWDSVIKPVWEGLATAAQWVATILLTVLIAPAIVAWNALAAAFKAAWDVVIKPTWDAIAAVATWLWQVVLVPAFNGIQLAFQLLGDGIKWYWENVIRVAWDAISAAATWLWQNVLAPNFAAIRDGFSVLASGIAWAWENVIRPAWDALGAALTWLWDSVVSPVVGRIADRWNWMSGVLDAGRVFIVDTVFGGIGRGLDTVRGWFQTAVDAITRIWDGIKSAAARPVRFVVDTVFNNGIRKAWNLVAKFTGLEELGEVSLGGLGAYAHGGVLPGYTPGRDPYTFIEPRTGMRIGLSGGEAILRPEATKALGKDWVDNVNNAARRGGARAVAERLAHSHFATGGIVGNFASGGITNLAGALSAIQESHAKFVARFFPGMFSLTSASRSEPGSMHDYSRAAATDWQAKDGQFASQMPTPASKALARAIYTNFPSTMQLIHWPLDGWQNLYAGNPHNYGAGTNAGHGNHVHWGTNSPLKFDGDDIVLEDVPGVGGGWNPINMVKTLWDGVISKIGNFADAAKYGLIGQLPAAMAKKLIDSAWNFVSSKAQEKGAYHGAVGAGVEQWRPMVEAVLKDKGFPVSLTDTVLRRMNQESGGNVRALNDWDINAVNGTPSKGLMQVIDPTFRAHKDPGYDDIWDPEANLRASMNYAVARYGSLPAAYNRAGGYALGGIVDLAKHFKATLFDTGGVWKSGTMGVNLSGKNEYVFTNDAMKAFQAATSDLSEAAAKLSDASNLDGIAARAGVGKFAEIAGMLGLGNVQTVTSGLLGAEKELLDARAGHTARITDITAKEKALEEARNQLDILMSDGGGLSLKDARKLADAEKALAEARQDATSVAGEGEKKAKAEAAAKNKVAKAEEKLARIREDLGIKEGENAEKHAEKIVKANEEVAKAEAELVEAREKSAAALDMRVFDVAPQIHGMLSEAAAASAAVPAVSNALAGLAATAGPAGISVGVAIQGIITGINLFKTVMGVITDFVSGIYDARAKMFALQAQALQAQYEWAKTVDDMRAKVVEFRVSWVEAQVALRDATWKTRLAQADVVRAQLQGVKTVAEAEAKLEAERKRVARAAARDLNDMSLLYDRYRWLQYKGMVDQLDLAVAITPEILALEAEVNAAQLTALANQRSASLAALQASWEQQKAALNLQQVQANLAMQTQQLALMQSQFGGFGQAESLQAMNTAKLYEERSKVQSQIGQSFWRLSYWLTGAGSADKQRIAELDRLIAEREANGQGAGAPGRGTGAMSFFGYGDSAMNAVRNGGYGAAEQAMADFQEKQQLQQIELQKQQLEQQIEQNKLFVAYQKQIGDLTAEIEALKAGAASAQYTADSYREDNPAVKAALAALAQFEAGRASQYADVAAGRRQVVEITVPDQEVYSRGQMNALLDAVKQLQAIDARVTMLETPAKPGANQVLQDISRRY